MDIGKINDQVSVSGQISVADMVDIKAAGFEMIVNNRPDGEAPGQPSGAEVKRAAEAAGLKYVDIPVGREGFSDRMLDAAEDAFANGGKVLAYCRSGQRSIMLWALSQAGRMAPEQIIGMAHAAGYDIAHMASALKR